MDAGSSRSAPAGGGQRSELLVSIITPTLNRAAMLSDTIASIDAQTYEAIEHIVVDGGSTDGTLELLQGWEQRSRIRWMSEPDTGMYNAINKGIRLAKGEIIAYLNSDDLYFPWTVASIVEAFRRHPDADLVFGDVLSIDERTMSQRIHWQYPFDLDYIRRAGFLAQPSVFWRRSLIAEVGLFDESLRYVADCDYWMKVGGNHRFLKVNELVAIELDHPEALRERNRKELGEELSRVRARYVAGHGVAHRLALVRHRFRLAGWRRLYWARLVFSRALGQRDGPWTRFLADPRTRVSARWLLVLLLPWIGRVTEDKILASSTWLPERGP